MNTIDRIDYAFLIENARIAKQVGVPGFMHLDQPIGIMNYIRIANDIVAQISAGHVLDWGCGYGQMTYLLRRRGLEVTPFDIGRNDAQLPDIPLCRELDVVRTIHPTELPFVDAGFDAVLSSGVLEHVDEHSEPGNEKRSLIEIARVLRPRGKFLIYQLPQQYAWQEAIIRRFKLGYAHPRRYTASEVTAMLYEAGFDVIRMRRANLIPKNLTGMPASLRRIYSRFSRFLITVDGQVCRIPLLNQLAGVMEITAVRIG